MSEFEFKQLNPLLRTVPNKEAPVLSRVLGIPYEPAKVVPMDARNKYIILAMEPEITNILGLQPRDLFRETSRVWSGQYIFEYNCRFQWPTSDRMKRLRVIYHEETHAVILQGNPKLAEEETTMEEAMTGMYFKEGLAEWGSSQAVGTVSGRSDTELAKWHLGVILRDNQANQLRVKLPNEDETEINPEVYYQGHLFAYFAMRLLGQAGLSVAEGFNLMIKNPPTRFEEIKNAKAYAKSLI